MSKKEVQKTPSIFPDIRLSGNYPKMHELTEKAVMKMMNYAVSDKCDPVELPRYIDSISKYFKNTFADPDFLLRVIDKLPKEKVEMLLATIAPEQKEEILKKDIDSDDIFN